jgi:hypothetical protein
MRGRTPSFCNEGELEYGVRFEVREGYIQTIYSIRNPEKLKQISALVKSGVRS